MIEIRNAAVICGEPVADGLMMMVASHRLLVEGAQVVTIHNRLHELKEWFPGHAFAPRLPSSELALALQDFDLVIIQYDGTLYAKELIQLFQYRERPRLSVFYPLSAKYSRMPVTKWDRIFDRQRSMVDNVAFAVASLLHQRDHSKNNGLFPHGDLLHRKNPTQVAIYPSPANPAKYHKIAAEIERRQFTTLFLNPDNLAEGAQMIYESGYFIGPESDLCHLASNLQIPTLVVSGQKKPLSLLKPGWLQSSFITPPLWIPRARERFIFTPRVVRAFEKLVAQYGGVRGYAQTG